MSEIMIHKTRAAVVESIHRGDAVVVKPDGSVFAQCGDKDKFTYFRSSAKPIQALNVVLSGAVDKFGITDRELALICSSHYAEDYHVEAARSILKKCGLAESALQCGAVRSINPAIALAQAEQGIYPQRVLSDCSGKHSGMLASCVIKGYPIETYLQPGHPLQQEIIHTIAEVCQYPVEKIGVGIDGCGVPVFALPIYNMALGFVHFANPQYLPDKYQNATAQIFTAMNRYPEMVSGTNGFCTALMKATKGRLIGKIGAQGVYCIGIKDPQLGIALKIEDGMLGMAAMAAMQVLTLLDLLSDAEYSELQHYHKQPITNDEGTRVGDAYPVFQF